MSIKQTLTAFAAVTLLTPSIFFGMDTSNQVTTFDRIRDFSTGIVLAGATSVVDTVGSLHRTPIEQQLLYKTLAAPLAASSLLFGVKAFSNATWSDILTHKKAALGKYLLYGSLASFFGFNISKVSNCIGGYATSNGCTRTQADTLAFGTGGISIGLAGTFGSTALKHLNTVLSAPRA